MHCFCSYGLCCEYVEQDEDYCSPEHASLAEELDPVQTEAAKAELIEATERWRLEREAWTTG